VTQDLSAVTIIARNSPLAGGWNRPGNAAGSGGLCRPGGRT
jgi:hypothetical protein